MAARRAPASLLVLALLVGGCASDGADSVESLRYESARPESTTPAEVTEMRETLAEQRSETETRLDTLMGGAASIEGAGASPWYAPIFDTVDFLLSVGHLIW